MRLLICLTTCMILTLATTPGWAQPAPVDRPATQPVERVNLLAMGDWGTNGPGQRAVARALAQYAPNAAGGVAGMLLLGDNFYMKLPGGVNDPVWQSAFEKMYDPVQLNFPFFAALGNHDYQNGKDAIELEYARVNPSSRWKLPGRWYRIDVPQENPLVTVLMLDSNKELLGPDRWAQEKAWLEAELSKPRGAWTVCSAHHPLFSNGGHGDNGVLQNEWGPLLLRFNVDFYLCGHDHDLQHLQMPDWFTSFVLLGGGGQDLKLMRHDDRGPMSRLSHGFGHLEFTTQTATVRYVDEKTRTIHQFTRDKTGKVEVQIVGGHSKAAINPLRALEGFGGYKPGPSTRAAPSAGD